MDGALFNGSGHLYSIGLLCLFSVLIMLALFGNLLVCAAVYWDRTLRRQHENLFLVSLAVSDLLVSLLVMVFAAANDLLGYWPFGAIYCQVWVCLDITCSTASILNLCAIAMDRYWHISRPLIYISRRKSIYVIIVVWIISLLVGAVQIVLAIAQHGLSGLSTKVIGTHDNVSLPVCNFMLQPMYAIGSSMCSFFVPAVIMLLLYVRLYFYARQHVHGIRSQFENATNFLLLQLSSERVREAASTKLLLRGREHHRSERSNSAKHRETADRSSDGRPLITAVGNTKQMKKRFQNFLLCLRCKRREDIYHNSVPPGPNMPSLPHGSSVSDQKARMTLGVIMGTFLICWLPFFIINILRSLAPDAVSHRFFQAVTWLGYANSTANPLIYSILNRDFRCAFKRILSRIFSCSELFENKKKILTKKTKRRTTVETSDRVSSNRLSKISDLNSSRVSLTEKLDIL
ncbi:hypothetical protein AB6A40_003519 [Gnathostoma spinigerum]|uniref:G-protein coupled receptors family 1 profile domain-containing protein n=1 Tax=Gnathostoma spinigerum TaxID=75299 RepID=A0ABD6EAZ6_9BILA